MELTPPGSLVSVTDRAVPGCYLFTQPFLIYTCADAVINPERSSYLKKAPASAPRCGFRPFVRVELPSSQSRAHRHF